MQGKCSPDLLMVIVVCDRWMTIALIYDLCVLQNNHTALCLNKSKDLKAPNDLFTFMLEEDQYLTMSNYRDCVLGSECSDAGDLHLILCLNASCVDTA